MFKQTTLTTAALTLVLALTSTAASAAPLTSNFRAYEVTMDCYHSEVKYAGSKNALQVIFTTSSGKTYKGRKVMQPEVTCSRGDQITYRSPAIALPNSDTIIKVDISAGGQDALWTNKVQIHQYDKGAPNTGFKHLIPGNWDAGHNKGFCLSTDRSDMSGPLKRYAAGGCFPKMTFQIGQGPQSH